ncbi:hypothetical protein LTR35_007442 [Friedmanniomyces endolithicus]|nr:hypothetical protein LTR35_007442 [Friedmanniomyces endolithicus]KAK0297246.1 hypothetical protein LTS00_003967 [Friedmanniomyces endolithicus]KAK1008399.1 hypothetical protein LTR54_006192 [Friedmanniomyces endolithicus]
MALAISAAAISRAAQAARDASSVLDDLLVSAKFKDESLRRDLKHYLEDIDALQSRLAIPESSHVHGSEEQQALHAKLQDAMTLCAGTFDQLTLHARDAGKVKSGIFRQGRKLSGKDEVVIRPKQRIPVHAMTAQLLSSIFHVRCVLQDLQWSALPESVRNLQRRRARLQSSCQVNSPHLGQDQELCNSVAGLIAEADVTLEYATTVLEDPSHHNLKLTASKSVRSDGGSLRMQSSIIGASVIHSTSTDHLHGYQQRGVSHSDASLALPPPQLPEKSVLRAPRIELNMSQVGSTSPVNVTSPNERDNTVIQWIDNLAEREKLPRPAEVTGSPSVISSSVASGEAAPTTISDSRSLSTGERLSTGHTSWTLPSISGSLRGKIDTSEIDDLDEDGITIELARNIISSGQSALDGADHQGAKGYFLEALVLIQRLPYKAQLAACNMLDLRYNIAMCSLVLDGQNEIEKALLAVLQHEPSSDVQREKLFHVSHALAQLYITTGRLVLARQSCNNALRGRRSLLGKQHQDYYHSLALMARISELDGADIQAKAYRDMIPGAEQHKFAFDTLKMDVYCEKEAVDLADAERQSLSSEMTIQDPVSRHPTQRATGHAYGSPLTVADRQIQCSKESWSKNVPSPAEEAPSAQTIFSVAPDDLHTYRPFSQVSDMASESGFLPNPLIISHSQEPASIPQPSPGNDYLGFCKAGWQLQAGDRSVMKKTKQSSLSAPSTYWLCCTGPRCYFTTEIETSAIGTWESVERKYQKLGVAYRFAFLAKSHVRQNKVSAGQALYKCLFCIFLGVHAPIIQGTEAYIDHVAQKHRPSSFSQVILYRTGCVNDRVCAAGESFDINLYPVMSA